MSANADVKIRVQLADSASAKLLQSLGAIDKETGKITTAATRAGGALEAATKKGVVGGAALTSSLTTVEKALSGISVDAAKAGSAVEGIAQKGSSGGAALGKMSRELDHMSGKASSVGRSLSAGLKTALSHAEKMTSVIGKAGVSGYMGVQAAASVLKPQVDFDRQVSLNAGIMFGTKGDDGHVYSRDEAKVQKKRLTDQVDTAVAGGAGTREQGVAAQAVLLQSGKFNGEDGVARINAMLRSIMQSSAASGTDPEAMAAMAVSFVEKGLNDKQVNAALGKGMVADSMGAFGVKDMAKWMPKWLSGAGKALDGEHAADSLVVHAQTARKSAGSADEAGVNLENLIGYATSDKGDKALKARGIDRGTEVTKNMNGGDDFIEGYARMMNKAVENDKGFQALKQKAAAEKTDEGRARVLNEMAGYTEQGVIGDVVADIQARKALMAEMLALDKNGEMKTAVKSEDGSTVKTSYGQRVEGDAKTSFDATGNAKDMGITSFLEKIAPKLSTAADWFGSFAKENPTATGAGVVGGTALTAGGGSWQLMSVIQKFLGRAAVVEAGATGTAVVATGAEGAAAAGAGAAAGGSGVAAVVGTASAALAPLLAMFGVAQWAQKEDKSKEISWTMGISDYLSKLLGREPMSMADRDNKIKLDRGEIDEGEYNRRRAFNKRQDDWMTSPDAPANNVRGEGMLNVNRAALNAQPAAAQGQQAPASEQLIQANAQLQQSNQQLAQIAQVANNDKLMPQLGQISSGIAALASKESVTNVYIDGQQVAGAVNKVNGNQAARG